MGPFLYRSLTVRSRNWAAVACWALNTLSYRTGVPTSHPTLIVLQTPDYYICDTICLLWKALPHLRARSFSHSTYHPITIAGPPRDDRAVPNGRTYSSSQRRALALLHCRSMTGRMSTERCLRSIQRGAQHECEIRKPV